MRYRADLTAGALKVAESRIIARLLLDGLKGEELQEAILVENVLQSRNIESSRRIGRMIRQRLELMKPELWELIRDGSGTVAVHACLAAAIKHSYLLGDFLDLVLRLQYKLYAETLSNHLWDRYLEDCRSRDPEMPEWSEMTKDRLRRSVFLVLNEAGYILDSRSLRLQSNYIAKPVISYLINNNEDYVLRCIQVSP